MSTRHLIPLLMIAGFGIQAFAAEGMSARKAVATTPTPVTAQDQSTTVPDAELTRRIRQELMKRDVSMQAKNVTIVTMDGMTVLKGTVPNQGERSLVGDIAKAYAPDVRNEIVVQE